ncbi:MAG: DNA-binding MarR family transcriptional regulator [Bacteroidia bacterium]|jgi:DNA-binding MarR family transcriptional regulator
MKLKKQLKVKSFRNKWEKLLLNFQLCNTNINAYIRDCFREAPITYSQYTILNIITSAEEPVNQLYIKKRIIEHDSDVSRLIARMIQIGVISKKPSKLDKRHAEISITAYGQQQLLEIKEKIHSVDEVFFNLSGKEVKQLNELLDKVRLS